ncbi:sorbitol dehydrogenase-like isoform X3 [Photinus pyralis]|uniref:sorbitol dehydrogenase-like isoform X3 n=1 Tax=Photinus pyralis TaxID=7054 RepID=UPI0012677385|nr:sorbitol dehydrogenase-like isoform X3 [Photinus pyralis]
MVTNQIQLQIYDNFWSSAIASELFVPHQTLLLEMQAEDNLTAVLYGVGDLRLEQRPIREPKDDEVLLKIDVVGICGSDLQFVYNGYIGSLTVDKPVVLGHEVSGTVWKVGRMVKNLKRGNRVAVDPGVECAKCRYCREGRGNLCINSMFAGAAKVDGCLSRFYTHPANDCYKLPDHVSLEEGAFLELISVGIHACKRGGVGFGSVVLIQGSGSLGLVTLLVCRAFGASKVIMTDYLQSRLDKAKELGADLIVQVHPNDIAEVVNHRIISALGHHASICIDCVGTELTMSLALKVTASGGIIVLVAVGGGPTVKIPITEAVIREIDIRGARHYINSYSIALDMVASGTIDVKPLITHHYRLEEILKALNTSRTREGDAIKVFVHTNRDWVC